MSSDSRLLRTRTLIDELDRRCTQLWSVEPSEPRPDRTTALRRLSDIERRVATCALRSLTVIDDDEIDGLAADVERCRRYLDALAGQWPSRVAA